ncbi:GNVR domain-containing protein [Paraburkholderia sabiae]|uniref:GNVR domain-containing protein n=1 Tax=Paraburkholderia sabiae TaxID=273251 RepID=A0ABU9QNU5_9BURK|nr:GNVR domain-containing protein [Paraburkholderia sabiae]WJZ72975.1 GNVR domain-containing protein [Paraburkholderia sabiae]CAD6562342.1 Tyrosine-protein kinase ptk [Paraburkholderia sabiae]CAG9193135.1 Putative tyrosine-protein kinase EpsB [Paraburkholderia sabiae]
MKQREYLLEGSLDDGMAPPDGGYVGKLLDTLYEGRKTIVIVTMLFTLVGIVYAMLARPVYQADMLIHVEDSDGATKNALADLSAMFAVKTAASAEIEVLRSRMVVSRAVQATQLYISATPRYFPVVGRWIATHLNVSSWSGRGGYAWGDEAISVSRFDVPDRLHGARFILTYKGNGEYVLVHNGMDLRGKVGETLHVEVPGGAIDLLVSAIDGHSGATFELSRSSELAATLDLQSRLMISEKGKESSVIGAALEGGDPVKTSVILNAIGNEYMRQKVQRTQEEAEKSIAFLNQQLPELKATLERAEEEYNQFRSEHGAVDLGAEAAALLQSTAAAQARIADLRQQRAQLDARYMPDNPALIAINGQLSEAEKAMAELGVQTKRLPPLEQSVLRLQREVQVDTNIYTNLLNTKEQMRLLKAGKVSNARLIDSAAVPEGPIRPRRTLIVVAGSLTGVFVGAAIVLFRRRMNSGIAMVDEIEAGAGLHVYASVPRSRVQQTLARRLPEGVPGTCSVLARTASFDAAVESLRSFRGALEFALRDAPNHVVLLAGPTPMVGKSFVSVNLAALLGSSGQRVLLIDTDLRRGTLNAYVGVRSMPGITDIMQGAPYESVVHRQIMPGVDFVANGGYVANASELLRHSRFRRFVEWADGEYDVVLMDAPPILPVADSGIVAHLAGMVFLVARQGVTSVSDLRESVRRFGQIGVPIRGVVFNDMTSRPGKYGSEYAAYGYASYSNADGDVGNASNASNAS